MQDGFRFSTFLNAKMMNGWLMKRSNHFRKYNLRYFRLHENRLSYYTTPKSTKPRRTMLIGADSSIRVEDSTSPRSRMSIIMRAGQELRDSHRQIEKAQSIVLTISDKEKSGEKYRMILCRLKQKCD